MPDNRRKAFISINTLTIRRNAIHGREDPPIRIAKSKSDAKPRYASSVRINGPSRLVYSHNGAMLRCGARMVLIADYDDVEVI